MTSQTVAKAKALDDAALIAFLTRADDAYYNSDSPLLSDTEYDLLREELAARKSKAAQAYLAKVGHAPPKRSMVSLPRPMPSQDKIKPDDGTVAKFADKNVKYVVMDKLDGVSVLADYQANKPPKLYTRGDTTTGQDVTRLLPHLNIPKKLPRNFCGRAEILIPRATFERFSKENGGDYENARNMVIGVVGRLKDNSTAKHFDVVFYEAKGTGLAPSQQLKFLKDLGLRVPEYKVFDAIDDAALTDYLLERRRRSPYEIDGLIVAKDVPYAESTRNPEHSKAFKVNTALETEVVDVEWRPSRHGRIVPRIHVAPLRIGGVTVKHVTGHNAYFIAHGHRYTERKEYTGKPDKPIGPGAVVMLSRSGDVIPHIVEVVKPAPPKYPDVPYEWDDGKVELLVAQDGDRTEIVVKRIVHFFATLGVDDLGASRIRQLIAAGYTSAIKILRITEADLLKLDGFQATLARKLVRNIAKARSEASLAKWADASGVFGSGMGERRAEMVFSKYPTIYEQDPHTARALVMQLSNFSDITADQFVQGLETFAKFLRLIKYEHREVVRGTKLAGLTVVFTGFRDADAEKLIAANGGRVASSVSNGCVLVVKDLASASSKAAKARALGVPVLTRDQFAAKYLSGL